MCAILANISHGDEVIIPSYTFVSTANAFARQGARIVFVDSTSDSPNMDTAQVSSMITPRTKAIVVVHYGGIACDMESIIRVAQRHQLVVIEDAAHGLGSCLRGQPLGAFGHLATFSFHETKNITSGEGGMLVVNDPVFDDRADIIWEKGTNRKAFYSGEVDKYNWLDVGSSFLPSEITAAFLLAQLESMTSIQEKRMAIWNRYLTGLDSLQKRGLLKLAYVPDFATPNGHIFYMVCDSLTTRNSLLSFLNKHGISAVFHYQSLHASPFIKGRQSVQQLPWSDHYSNCLIRLPLFPDLTLEDQNCVIQVIYDFYAA